MNQPSNPEPSQRLNIDEASIQGSQLAQAGRDLTQIQGQVINMTIYDRIPVAGFGLRQTLTGAKPLNQQEYRYRKVLLSKVKNFWIESVLEKSLHAEALIELGLEERLDKIERPFDHIQEIPNDAGQLLPSGTEVEDVFSEMGEGRSLLILGEPGAGKTTTLLKLAQSLIARAETDLSQPLPVVFNLSAWGSKQQAIAEWLVQELYIRYGVSRSLAKTWVQEEQLLLLLDGLDEVKAECQEACVDALNQFLQTHGQTEIVVCSRLQDYEALDDRLRLQGAICIQSLTPTQIEQYLDRAGEQVAAIKTLLQEDTALQELAKSPLMLNVIVLAYQGIAVENLPQMVSTEERRQHLFTTYIDRMFQLKGVGQRYSRTQVMHWLTWLAQHLTQTSQTVFLIERIQPTWLQTSTQQVIYHFTIRFLFATAGAFHAGLLAGHHPNRSAFDVSHGLVGLGYGLLAALVYAVLGTLTRNMAQGFPAELLNALLAGLAFAPVFGWIYGWIGGLVYGLMYSVFGLFIYKFAHGIDPVDAIQWSWRKARNYSVFGLLIGLVLYLGNTVGNRALSLVFGGMVVLIFGFEKRNEVEHTTVPNQGIWRSFKNACILVVTIGLLTGLLAGVIESPVSGVVNGFILGIGSGLFGGQGSGITSLKHFVLRGVLCRSNYIPWNYARFLDYATARIFLQKVGGGYIFIHRMLLEYFAQLEKSS